jgi:hypothetical protein
MSYFPEVSTIRLGPIELKYLSEETVERILYKMLGQGYSTIEELIAKSGYWSGKTIGRAYYYVEKDKKRNLTIVEARVATVGDYDPVEELRYCKRKLAEIDEELEWFYNYIKREDLDSESREWAERMIKSWEEDREKVMKWYWQLDDYISELNNLLSRTQRRLEELKKIDDEIGKGSFKKLIEYVGEDYVRERLREIFLNK